MSKEVPIGIFCQDVVFLLVKKAVFPFSYDVGYAVLFFLPGLSPDPALRAAKKFNIFLVIQGRSVLFFLVDLRGKKVLIAQESVA